MWFLIRTAFWFSLVLVLLPVFSRESTDRLTGSPQVELGDAVTAASGAVSYLSSICAERPEVCTKGAETLTALGYRAKEGARVAYTMLDNQFGSDAKQTASAAPAGKITIERWPNGAPVSQAAADAAEALGQPMPAKVSAKISKLAADNVVTGTVRPLAYVPVPTRRPAI